VNCLTLPRGAGSCFLCTLALWQRHGIIRLRCFKAWLFGSGILMGTRYNMIQPCRSPGKTWKNSFLPSVGACTVLRTPTHTHNRMFKMFKAGFKMFLVENYTPPHLCGVMKGCDVVIWGYAQEPQQRTTGKGTASTATNIQELQYKKRT